MSDIKTVHYRRGRKELPAACKGGARGGLAHNIGLQADEGKGGVARGIGPHAGQQSAPHMHVPVCLCSDVRGSGLHLSFFWPPPPPVHPSPHEIACYY